MASYRKKPHGHEIVFTDSSRNPQQIALWYGSDYSQGEVLEIKKRLEEDYRWGLKDPWRVAQKTYNPKLPTAISKYIDYKIHQAEDWASPHTIKSNKINIEKFGQTYSGKKLRDLTSADIDDFVNEDHLARATKKSYLRDIMAFARWADLDIEAPPIRGNRQKKQVTYIRQGEVMEVNAQIAQEVQGQIQRGEVTKRGPSSLWLVDLLSWSFYSGMRPAEMLLLEHNDYEQDNGVVHVRRKTKSSQPRTLPIGHCPPLLEIMNNLTDPKVVRAKAEDPRWKTDRIFGHYGVGNASDKIKKYIKTTFGPERSRELSWYSYRHGCAVWLLSSGVSIYDVSRWLGHSSVRTTERHYADIVQEDLGKHIGRAHK